MALASLLMTAACGGGGDESAGRTPQVASLPSSDPSGGPAPSDASGGAPDAADDTSQRPRRRLDDTVERAQQLVFAYDDCLVAHGARYTQDTIEHMNRPPGPNEKAFRALVDPIPQAAKDACHNKLPLGPPELDPGLNPDYREDMKAEITCMRDHHILVHLVSEGEGKLTWTYDERPDPQAPDSQEAYAIARQCQLEAFRDK